MIRPFEDDPIISVIAISSSYSFMMFFITAEEWCIMVGRAIEWWWMAEWIEL